jgi:hypothetical protein
MKNAQRISILLNLGLVGCLFFLMQAKSARNSASPVPATSAPAQPTLEVAAPAPTVPPAPEPAPFRWSQLESDDYPTYVKNLRGIGCPESTLRAIVSADVHVVFHQRATELEQQLSDLRNASWSVQLGAFNTEQAAKSELRELPGMEAAEIDDLLGFKPADSKVTFAASFSPTLPVSDPPVPLPLVLQNIDLTTLRPSSDQLQVINDVRESFMKEIGGEGQDPKDPDYLQRWQKALPEADNQLRGMLGTSFFENYQLAAGN